MVSRIRMVGLKVLVVVQKNKNRVAVLVRHDKRSVKAASLKRELKDFDYGV